MGCRGVISSTVQRAENDRSVRRALPVYDNDLLQPHPLYCRYIIFPFGTLYSRFGSFGYFNNVCFETLGSFLSILIRLGLFWSVSVNYETSLSWRATSSKTD